MDVQGLEIDIRAMAAAGAESVSNGGCSPDDTLYLIGDPEEDRPRVNKFINKLHETSKPVGAVVCCLPDCSGQASYSLSMHCHNQCTDHNHVSSRQASSLGTAAKANLSLVHCRYILSVRSWAAPCSLLQSVSGMRE